jgi:outer membrane receptor protein involved in Fe transport
MLFDVDFFERTNLLIGARYDKVDAETTDRERFSQTCTTTARCTSASAFVGQILPAAFTEGSDDGTSYSASLSYKFPVGIVPYITSARSSLTLAAANNTIAGSTITAPGGLIGEAEITEGGVKSSLMDEHLFITLAGYKQTRTDISEPSDPTAGADVTSSETQGVEVEVKWVPNRNVFIAAFLLHQTSDYIFASTSNMEFNGRQLGFMDVLDPVTGAVIYPAEAFVFGGRLQVPLPAALRSQYLRRNGNPEQQFGVNGSYQVSEKLGINGGLTWFSEIDVTRVGVITVPEATVLNLGMTWDAPDWRFQLNIGNALDELYLRPRNGDGNANLMNVMPGRSYAVTVKHDF